MLKKIIGQIFAKKNCFLMTIISCLSLLFFMAVGFDISPYLRGPAPYPPQWQWPYYFVNTVGRIYLPFILIFFVLLFFLYLDKKNQVDIIKIEKRFLICLIFLSFLFQISVLYYSRSGIGVLFHRIANPDINGYFTASLNINNIKYFLGQYNNNVLQFPMHAKGHPPGGILFFWLINQVVYRMPYLKSFTNVFIPSRNDISALWFSLLPYQRLAAIISGLLIPFLSALTIIPLYFIGKNLYGIKIGLRASFLYVFIPSLVMFAPINDVFLPIFTALSFLFITIWLNKQKGVCLLLAGLLISLGIFFSLSLVPVLIINFIFLLSYLWGTACPRQKIIIPLVKFIIGALVLPVILFVLYHFNFITVGRTIINGLAPGRSYILWLFYNPYDFFIFVGVPILIIFLLMCVNYLTDRLFFAFLIVFLLLNFSGLVRAETARIWLPFVPMLVLTTTSFLTKKLSFPRWFFIIFLFLQAAQVLVLQTFWVALW